MNCRTYRIEHGATSLLEFGLWKYVDLMWKLSQKWSGTPATEPAHSNNVTDSRHPIFNFQRKLPLFQFDELYDRRHELKKGAWPNELMLKF